MMNALESTSTRPYLIRALYEWCTDNALTPYIAVLADETVQVPREFVQNGEIVLNISFDATSALKLGNEFIEFKARFAGVAREIMVPIDRVMAIYARENGQGMAFPVTLAAKPDEDASMDEGQEASAADADEGAPAASSRGAGIQLVPSSPASSEGAPDDSTDPPPAPPPGGGKRPALKRVK